MPLLASEHVYAMSARMLLTLSTIKWNDAVITACAFGCFGASWHALAGMQNQADM